MGENFGGVAYQFNNMFLEPLDATAKLVLRTAASSEMAGDAMFNGFPRAGPDVAGDDQPRAMRALVTGSPVLAGAVVFFDCRVVWAVEISTHAVLISELLGIRMGQVRTPALISDAVSRGGWSCPVSLKTCCRCFEDRHRRCRCPASSGLRKH